MAVTFRDDLCDKIRLKETLKKCLEKKREYHINKVVLEHHISESRRQFKTKQPPAFKIN